MRTENFTAHFVFSIDGYITLFESIEDKGFEIEYCINEYYEQGI